MLRHLWLRISNQCANFLKCFYKSNNLLKHMWNIAEVWFRLDFWPTPNKYWSGVVRRLNITTKLINNIKILLVSMAPSLMPFNSQNSKTWREMSRKIKALKIMAVISQATLNNTTNKYLKILISKILWLNKKILNN